MTTEATKSAVDRLGHLFTCGSGRGTAAVVFGLPMWSHCVRARGHDGDCVMGLTEAEQKIMAGTHEPHWMMTGGRTDESYMVWLRGKARAAEGAWGT